MKKYMKFFAFLMVLFSCSQFIKLADDNYYEELNNKQSNNQILFSHNINGETHPCGCRNFPLGGIEQVNAYMQSSAEKNNQIYVDTGDAFFESTTIPEFLTQSSSYTAEKIAESFDLLNLKFFVPGDQDFTLGEEFLVKLSQKHKFKFLISNASDSMKIKHIKSAYIKSGDRHLFFIGVTNPELFSFEARNIFTSPFAAIEEQLKQIEIDYKNIKNKTIILLSHSGLEQDKLYAEKFPMISWIIGAHTQSFLRYSIDVGSTQLVQVLSRNHYLGEINIPNQKELKSTYQLVEIRDDLKNLVSENKMSSWIEDYKNKLDQIFSKEQQSSINLFSDSKSIKTNLSCLDCHDNQYKFWQKTSHSLALITLHQSKAENNPKCIECHSVGFNQEGGFNSKVNMVKSDHKEFNQELYWKEFSQKVKTDKSIRSLSNDQRYKISNKWLELDQKHQLSQNHGNVQCLNCHDQNPGHPFNNASPIAVNYQNKCLTCHTQDQSPEWYNKDAKGLATSLNDKYFAKKLKLVSCPKN